MRSVNANSERDRPNMLHRLLPVRKCIKLLYKIFVLDTILNITIHPS